jgi:hypothetical protein
MLIPFVRLQFRPRVDFLDGMAHLPHRLADPAGESRQLLRPKQEEQEEGQQEKLGGPYPARHSSLFCEATGRACMGGMLVPGSARPWRRHKACATVAGGCTDQRREEMPEQESPVCRGCGQLTGVAEYDEKLWDIYGRIDDGRSTWEPLVYSGEEFHDAWDDLGETNYAMLAMEKNMHERGLCVVCGRPDLRDVKPEEILSEEDAREMQARWAEHQAEIRAGC